MTRRPHEMIDSGNHQYGPESARYKSAEVGPTVMGRGLGRLLVVTAGLTYVLVLLGVYTAAAGAGLACGARWPLCNGAVFGLFPANWLSFIEWFHRLVAAVTGLCIIGVTALAWRRRTSRHVRSALTLAVILLPAQIGLGALTVARYEWLILAAHFVTALVIFTGIGLAAIWVGPSGQGPDGGNPAIPAVGATGALVPVALLSPRVLIVFDAATQVAYYAFGLGAYAALLVTVAQSTGRGRALASVAATVVFTLLVVGRQTAGDQLGVLALAGTLVALGLSGGAAWVLYRSGRGPASRAEPILDGD